MVVLAHTVQFAMCILLIMVTALTSSMFFLLLVRFKALRTITNLLMAQLALSNLLCSSIGVSVFIYFEVMNLSKPWDGLISGFIYYTEATFCYVNAYFFILIAVDRYLTTEFEKRYAEWKSKNKVIAATVACWMFPMIANTSGLIGGIKSRVPITVGDYKMNFNSRMVDICHKAMLCLACVVLATVIQISVSRKINALKFLKRRNEKKKAENEELIAVKSLAITSVIYCISFALSIALTQLTVYVEKYSTRFVWCYFLSQYVIHIPSTMNIPITWLMTTRSRRALKKMFSDPCGNSDLVELKRFPPVFCPSQDGKSSADRAIMKPSESMLSSGRHSIIYRYFKNGVCVEYDMTHPSESFLEQSFNSLSLNSISKESSTSHSQQLQLLYLSQGANRQEKNELTKTEYSDKALSLFHGPQHSRHIQTTATIEEESELDSDDSIDSGGRVQRRHSCRVKRRVTNRERRIRRLSLKRTKSI